MTSSKIIQFPETRSEGIRQMSKLERILHVDDDDDVRAIVQITLELVGGYSLHQCASGPEAIETAVAFKPQLFLLDVMMPIMTGEETWRQLALQLELKDVPAIFMTAKAERRNIEKLMGQGALAVITKPFDPAQLCERIEQEWQSCLQFAV